MDIVIQTDIAIVIQMNNVLALINKFSINNNIYLN